ncbi:hypothetical protein NQ317_002584 [Molorchus minor]|uniref:Uncharacterized protein n=1 Tax=Molorchus minor TaxID=1323400 RepID=A0ABQ9JTF4_9CUCU|nr:hypothetical protein NQ317_002584 [Molorchus minor]
MAAKPVCNATELSNFHLTRYGDLKSMLELTSRRCTNKETIGGQHVGRARRSHMLQKQKSQREYDFYIRSAGDRVNGHRSFREKFYQGVSENKIKYGKQTGEYCYAESVKNQEIASGPD